MEELHQVISATPLDGLKVLVTFENGVKGVFDCEYLTEDPYWAKLKSPAFFRQVKAECGTLCWPEDIDVAPESVWEDVVRDVGGTVYTPAQDEDVLSVAEGPASPYQA